MTSCLPAEGWISQYVIKSFGGAEKIRDHAPKPHYRGNWRYGSHSNENDCKNGTSATS